MIITNKKRWAFLKRYKCTITYLDLYEMWVCKSKCFYVVGFTPEDSIDKAIKQEKENEENL